MNISADELNPEAQAKELRLYSTTILNIRSILQNDPDLDEGAQTALLEHWEALKSQHKSTSGTSQPHDPQGQAEASVSIA